jgi:predicted PurR-regulated permease PerM
VLVNLVEGYILGPRLVGKAVGLHPLISLLAVTLGAELFGLWGAIFAAPVAGVLQAFTMALWDNYRRTHSDEFPPEEQALADKRPEEPTATAVTPAFPAIDGTAMNE